MSTPYEILLRYNDAGVYQGGHTIRREGNALLPAQPIGAEPFPWPVVAAEINTAALARVTELEALLADAIAQKEAAESAAADASATAQATIETLTAERDELQATVAAGEAMQAQLVTAAKAAFAAGNMEQIAAILQTASETPAMIRERQRKEAALEQARIAYEAAQAALEAQP